MQHPTVKKLFLEQTQYYAKDESPALSPLAPLFLNWIKSKKPKRRSKICEFGGGGGQLLAEIDKKVKSPVEFFNIELVGKFQKNQTSKKIKFFEGSILQPKFPDKSFDVLIIRDVRHHLIGKNFKETRENQEIALKELKRLIRPGGLILIEELVNESAIVSKLIYYFSKINTKIGIRSRAFEISPYTMVAFLTPQQLLKMLDEIFGSRNIIKKSYLPFNEEWQARLVHLGFKSGKLILAIKN